MPYIGNDIQFGELTSQSFTGDGSTTAFTLSYTVANPTSLIVTIADVIQEPTTAYTVAGTTLTCTSAPADGDTIHVRFLGRVVDVANAAILQDSDQDTKVQVEESADEDTIRFDVAGTEVATLTNSALTLKGTTPTLTIGDAGAEDTKIVFDGNAQDYRIGLDDGTDTLEIGLGSAHGTTAHIITDANGIVRKPLQPAFATKRTSSGQTITSGTTAKVAFNTEEFDINADNATDTFTCPVDGRYLFSSAVQFGAIGTTNGGRMSLYLYKNDALYGELGRFTSISGAGLPFTEMSIVGAMVVDLDAADEVCLYLYNNSGATITLNYGTQLYNSWSGCLL